MEFKAFQVALSCVYEHYPEISAAALQVIGGATVLYRLLGSKKVAGEAEASGSWLGKGLKFLAGMALNKK